jgi:hypothetical protein
MYSRAALDIPQLITLEHVPPKTFGGKNSQGILLCGKCNHTSGSKLDKQIQTKLNAEDFLYGIPGSVVDGEYSIGPNISFAATLTVPEQGVIQIEGDGKRSDPKEKAKEAAFLETHDPQEGLTGRYSLSLGNSHLANIGLLRIAYLTAFKVFGYGFIFHKNLVRVREQILNPQEIIIPRTWNITGLDFQQLPTGTCAVVSPSHFRCLLVIFELRTKLRTVRQAIVLPSTEPRGLEIYDYLELMKGKSIKLSASAAIYQYNPELLTNPSFCFVTHKIWKYHEWIS